MRILGVDPGSQRTGYGCIDTDGTQHRVVVCGVLAAPGRATFPEKLRFIHRGLADLLTCHQPETVAIEDLFYAKNARSALTLGHVRGCVDARSISGRRSDCRVHAGGDQARRRRIRPGRESAGTADGDPPSQDGCSAVAAGCLRCPGRCYLPFPFLRSDLGTPFQRVA